jgi:cell division protein FtsI (penicillin-binding protein 3)
LDRYIASFVGFVPATKPVVAIAVMVDEPMVDHAGGSVAAPIFRRLAQMAVKYEGLTPRGTERADVAELARRPDPAHTTYELLRQAQGKPPAVQQVVTPGPIVPGQVRVPDMTGWPVREVVRRALELGVVPNVRGTGLLTRQQPAPGDVLSEGETLTVVFEPAT